MNKTFPQEFASSLQFIKSKTSIQPKVGIVLGSGLGKFADTLTDAVTMPYESIPHFSHSTIAGHKGALVIGKAGNLPVAVLQGRLHFYEGHSLENVVYPLRVLKLLGIQSLIMTNASGGINPSFRAGDLMMITDHINLTGTNPLLGPNIAELGPRFPDMTESYSSARIQLFHKIASQIDIELKDGVYAGVLGPCYETPAEIRMLRILGADAVGMSTVNEVIAASHMGLEVSAIACITNLAAGITSKKLSHEEVVITANQASDKLIRLLDTTLAHWSEK